MAKPRVFISSTYYDLKHVRSSLEHFVESLGFECTLSERGNIPYASEVPLDESCYREVENVDMLVLLIGGRYGSEASAGKTQGGKGFFDKYDSITKKEYETAVKRDIPVFIMIERSVYAEYLTFNHNRDTAGIKYAHVDSVNIFHLIDQILRQPTNNPVYQFDGHADIAAWLREQWAGLFRDLLARKSQLMTLGAQINKVNEVNATLKRYLEQVIEKVNPDQAERIIKEESQRLAAFEQLWRQDPNNGQFGGRPEANSRRLSAVIAPRPDAVDPADCRVQLTVESTDPQNKPLTGKVTFYLHPTFVPQERTVQLESPGAANLQFHSEGRFTVGVEADDGATRLELNLARVPGGTREFYEN
jgi:hypothetical protein